MTAMGYVRKALAWLFYGFVFFALLAAGMEIYLRWQSERQWQLGSSGTRLGLLPMHTRLNHRLWQIFFRDGDPRIQPNYHLGEVSLPPNQKWETTNFLRPADQKEASRYVVTTNALGLRTTPPGNPRAPRVLVLGGYQAFGHGVNDTETYAYLLGVRGWRTLNAGVPSANTDFVMKLLEKRWSELAADVVVLDLGMTDRVGGAGWMMLFHPQKILFTPGTYFFSLLENLNHKLFSGPLGSSYLLTSLMARGMKGEAFENSQGWRNRLSLLLGFLAERRARVILLDQPTGAFPESDYKAVVGHFPGLRFLAVARASREAGEPRDFTTADAAWLTEFPPGFVDFYRSRRPDHYYQGDILQGNRHLHRLIALLLDEEIKKAMAGPPLGAGLGRKSG